MSAIPNVINPPKPSKKSSVIRKSTRKPKAIQNAIIAKRAIGESKAKIARDLSIRPNTVTSILELSGIESQIEEYRQTAMGLVPLAITAVETDLKFPGNGSLGLRVLESTGVLGEDAIDSIRRHSQRQAGAINVLVQSGATLHMGDTPSHHNVPLSDTATIPSDDKNTVNNCTSTVNDKVTDTPGTLKGKHPKAAPTHQ